MTRTPWTDLPADARRAVEHTIGPVRSAVTPRAGVMSACVTRLVTDAGAYFAKGTPADAPDAWTYRHEFRVVGHVHAAPLPLWEAEGGGWRFYGYSILPGRHADFAEGSPDLGPVVEALARLSAMPWPTEISKRPLRERLAPFTPEGAGSALAGSALTHSDLGERNILVDGRTVGLVDWALSCPGPGWADAALWVPRLIAAGHGFRSAHALALAVPAYAEADPDALAVFARTVRSFWEHRATVDPLPHRAALVAAAREWERAAGRQEPPPAPPRPYRSGLGSP
ncbi:phosphotransferase [Streptomyces sp. NPDC021224]|uniref:phosphotransferase n=1 Tax=unclassified Streptomyces TaxID=2593676 RepID=UPI0037A4B7FE